MVKKKKKIYKSTTSTRRTTGSGYGGVKINKAKLSVAISVLVALIIGCYFLYMNTGYKEANAEELVQNGTFAEGIKVNGIDISGMTYAEAREKLDPVEFQKIENFDLRIHLNDKQYDIDSDDINSDTNMEDTLAQAIVLGQTGNRRERKKELKQIKKEGREFFLRYTYDSDLLNKQLTEIQNETGMAAKDATVKIEGGEIIYIEGQKGIKIDKDKLEQDISVAMDQNLEQIDVYAQTVEVTPTVTVEALKQRLVKKASTTTTFKSSTSSRVNNVVKAAGLLNGEMIPAGATFSINSVLGARTKENGWSVATGISEGKYIDDVGGGVCQVSSTLYNSAVKAGLDIVERRQHTYPVDYLPAGQDAAISTGGPDLKLRNPYDFPIYIVAYGSSSSRTLDVMIYGPKNEDGGSYVFKSEEIENEQPSEKAVIKENSNLMEGEYVEIKPRKNRVAAKRWVEYVIDGEVVRTENMSTDYYSYSRGEYAVGPDVDIDSETGKPKGKKVSEYYLTHKRTTTQATTTTVETKETTEKTTEKTKETTTKKDSEE